MVERVAPPPARLWSIAERVDQLGRFARHPFCTFAHGGNLAMEQAKGIAALGLDLGDLLFIFLQPFVHRLEQRLDALPGRFLRLAKARLGPIKKLFLGRFQQLTTDFAELC